MFNLRRLIAASDHKLLQDREQRKSYDSMSLIGNCDNAFDIEGGVLKKLHWSRKRA